MGCCQTWLAWPTCPGVHEGLCFANPLCDWAAVSRVNTLAGMPWQVRGLTSSQSFLFRITFSLINLSVRLCSIGKTEHTLDQIGQNGIGIWNGYKMRYTFTGWVKNPNKPLSTRWRRPLCLEYAEEAQLPGWDRWIGLSAVGFR